MRWLVIDSTPSLLDTPLLGMPSFLSAKDPYAFDFPTLARPLPIVRLGFGLTPSFGPFLTAASTGRFSFSERSSCKSTLGAFLSNRKGLAIAYSSGVTSAHYQPCICQPPLRVFHIAQPPRAVPAAFLVSSAPASRSGAVLSLQMLQMSHELLIAHVA